MKPSVNVYSEYISVCFASDEFYTRHNLNIQDAVKLMHDLNNACNKFGNNEEKDDIKQLSDEKASEIRHLQRMYHEYIKYRLVNDKYYDLLTAMYEFMVMQHFKKDQE